MTSRISLEQESTSEWPAYSPRSLEPRWQEVWRERRSFATPGPQDEGAPAYVFADCPLASTDAGIGQIRSLTIADAYARFLRARGQAVLFSLGFDAFGQSVEVEMLHSALPPSEWVQRRCEHARTRFQALGYSCDWERAFVSSDHQHYRWTQSLFLALLERDVIYRGGTHWFMRVGQYVNENERSLEALAGWDAAAIEAQRAVIDRVDGVEIQAGTFAGESLTVFTPHADAVAQATFVAVSPAHPQVGQWTSDPDVAERVAGMRELARHEGEDAGELPVAVTGALATVPGVAGIIPIVVSPLVDARFGPTAVLGIPELDAIDREIAKSLPAPAGAAWKASGSGSAARPAVRYRVPDLPISRARAWGAPIPLVHCSACGIVPVGVDELPVRLPDDLQLAGEDDNPLASRSDFRDCTCPRCGSPARREAHTIDPRLDRMWMWMASCVPPGRRSSAMMGDPECARWLPVEQVISQVGAARCMFERRLFAQAMQALGELPALPSGEPFSRALLHHPVRFHGATSDEHAGAVGDPDELIALVGGDVVRLSVLYAAAPTRTFSWAHQPWRHCQRFLQSLHGYAEPRLSEWAKLTERPEQATIDASDELRRRLAHWCVVACEKITLQLEHLALQRAAHNAMLLLTRIQDFESRVLERRAEIETLDREAIVAALLLLVRLLAPLTPHIAEELWSVAGNTTPVGDAGWPTLARPGRPDVRPSSAVGLSQ